MRDRSRRLLNSLNRRTRSLSEYLEKITKAANGMNEPARKIRVKAKSALSIDLNIAIGRAKAKARNSLQFLNNAASLNRLSRYSERYILSTYAVAVLLGFFTNSLIVLSVLFSMSAIGIPVLYISLKLKDELIERKHQQDKAA